MISVQALADKAAISLSFICAVHCLAMPLIFLLLPSLAAIYFDDETAHLLMLFAVLPVSIFALTMGCTKHKDIVVFILGAVGLAILVTAVLLGHDALGELVEKVLILSGATIIALSHIRNHALCQRSDCDCHS
tara:strand:+ start:1839 stop:2237 length:399 start_codon:yes stop_codon:yes gene_type:complete